VEAENLLVRVLAGNEEILGLSHPYTQNAVEFLVSLYKKLGRSHDAKMLDQRVSPMY
jgi:hypothetical protein